MVADAMRFKAAASMIATHIFVAIIAATRRTREGIKVCAVMGRQAEEGMPARGQVPLGTSATVALHDAAPPAECRAWVEEVCEVKGACVVAVEACGAAVAVADIANSGDESHKTRLELVHVHQNGERDHVV